MISHGVEISIAGGGADEKDGLVLTDRGELYVSYPLSLFSHFLHTTIAGREHSTMEESFGLWIEEGKFVLYLVSRATCKVGLSCGGTFLSSVQAAP